MSFGKNLRYLRKKKDLSQDYIADLLGYKNYTTIQKWESGQSEPNVEKLKAIAVFFDVTMDELLNDDLTQPENTYGDHKKNLEHLADKPELLNLYNDIYESETLQLLFDNARDLEPEDLEAILIHIKGIRTARGLD